MRRRPDAGAYAQLALYRQLAAAAVRGTELITEALVTQTDPAREPSPADILAAIVSVGQSFHDLHLAIADVGKQVADLREERRRDWEQVHAQIAAERRRREQDVRLLDDRIDSLAREVDTLTHGAVAELTMRLEDHEARLKQLEEPPS